MNNSPFMPASDVYLKQMAKINSLQYDNQKLESNLNNSIAYLNNLKDNNMQLMEINNHLRCINIKQEYALNNLNIELLHEKQKPKEKYLDFVSDFNGCNAYIKNGTKKEIGIFKIKDILYIIINDIKYIFITYYYTFNKIDSAFFLVDKMNDGNLLKYFTSFMRKCSKGLANEFLYHAFKKCIYDAESYKLSYIPEHTGIIKFNNRYQYYRYMKLPDKVEKCVSENYKSKYLPYTELSAADISDCLNPFVNGHEMMFLLITFSLMGMLSSVIEKTFHIQNVLLIISTYENSMAKKLCSCILRTFNKDKPPVSLTLRTCSHR